MKIFYTVAHGCNSRHLHDVEVFDLLKEAKEFVRNLRSAYLLQRHSESDPFNRVTKDLSKRIL